MEEGAVQDLWLLMHTQKPPLTREARLRLVRFLVDVMGARGGPLLDAAIRAAYEAGARADLYAATLCVSAMFRPSFVRSLLQPPNEAVVQHFPEGWKAYDVIVARSSGHTALLAMDLLGRAFACHGSILVCPSDVARRLRHADPACYFVRERRDSSSSSSSSSPVVRITRPACGVATARALLASVAPAISVPICEDALRDLCALQASARATHAECLAAVGAEGKEACDAGLAEALACIGDVEALASDLRTHHTHTHA